MVEHLAKRSCVVVSDDFPCFFYRALYERIAPRFSSRFELVDSNGILPLRAADRTFTVAHSYRRFMQKEISKYWTEAPKRNPFQRLELPKIEEGLSSIVSKGGLQPNSIAINRRPQGFRISPSIIRCVSLAAEEAFVPPTIAGGISCRRNSTRMAWTETNQISKARADFRLTSILGTSAHTLSSVPFLMLNIGMNRKSGTSTEACMAFGTSVKTQRPLSIS